MRINRPKAVFKYFKNCMSAFAKMGNYFKEAIAEMKKVVWPTRKQTITYSAIVIALSVGTAIFFMALDQLFNIGLEALLR